LRALDREISDTQKFLARVLVIRNFADSLQRFEEWNSGLIYDYKDIYSAIRHQTSSEDKPLKE
jgi:hypothetical protein